MKVKTNLRLKAGIVDPVPLIDVLIQLVIFFVLAVFFIGKTGLMLQLPSIGMPVLYKENTTRIKLINDKLFFEDKNVSIHKLKEELGKGLVTVLVIEADKDIPNARVVEIIDLAQQMGVSQIAIAAEPEKPY